MIHEIGGTVQSRPAEAVGEAIGAVVFFGRPDKRTDRSRVVFAAPVAQVAKKILQFLRWQVAADFDLART